MPPTMAPNIIQIGDTPNVHISSADVSGIQQFFNLTCAVRARLNTGAAIKATTAGLIPMKMCSIMLLPSKCLNPMAKSRMMQMGMNMLPNMAEIAPPTPLSLYPMLLAIFTAKIPGMDCPSESRSKNSSREIQHLLSTSSFSIKGIIANPPPIVNAPILKNDTASCA